ncbi:hypothetical protein C2869_01380 [Saccharobesus litoralis]|uniref:histidine kinase n=1 Tax=Saccharobesus litoralis TaxID=2172099 RepID=A0A2S0VLT4_9ALTE|nr:ATP-binding protein [Saccharobesus litoralis]AWB65177.1 hypothetical protein C2869_01380 [Saccharobesus litoralis]
MNISFSNLARFNPFNYLFGKIFLGFWGTVIAVIVITFIILRVLHEQQSVMPAEPGHMRFMHSLAQQLAKADPSHLERQVKRIQRNQKIRRTIIKNLQTGEYIYEKALPKQVTLSSLQNLSLQPKPLQIKVADDYLIGPVSFANKTEHYQLFLIMKASRFHHYRRMTQGIPPWLLLGIAALFTIIPCWLIARGMSKPIKTLRQSTQALAAGNLTHRVRQLPSRPDEIGDLASDFNLMAEKLESLVNLHKRLLADVSHELRTPLTRMELSLAMALKNPHDNQAYLTRIENELHRMDDMIGNILRLARLENDQVDLDEQTFNLSSLMNEIIESAQVEVQAKQLTVNAAVIRDVVVSGDPVLMSSAIENVVRNAIKYAKTQGQLWISLSQQNDFIELAVRDDGPGIKDQQELDKIFMPFYRVAEARDRTSGGTGLGLAIAKKAIAIHGGDIRAKNHQEGGLVVSILLPVSLQR